MVPFWVPIIVRHLIFRVPKKDHNFDNHPYIGGYFWIMEKKMETTILVLGFSGGIYRGYIWIMEKKMELTILVLGFRITFLGVILGHIWNWKRKLELLFGF